MQEVKNVTAASRARADTSSSNTSSLSSVNYTVNNNNKNDIDIDNDTSKIIVINNKNGDDDYNKLTSSITRITITPPSRPGSSTTSLSTRSVDIDNTTNDGTFTTMEFPTTLSSTSTSTLLTCSTYASQSLEYGRSLTSIYTGTTVGDSSNSMTWGQDGADDAREIEVDDVLDCYGSFWCYYISMVWLNMVSEWWHFGRIYSSVRLEFWEGAGVLEVILSAVLNL